MYVNTLYYESDYTVRLIALMPEEGEGCWVHSTPARWFEITGVRTTALQQEADQTPFSITDSSNQVSNFSSSIKNISDKILKNNLKCYNGQEFSNNMS